LLLKHSGFVCSFDDRWYFVTAGHVLKNIHDYLQYAEAKIGACHLMDNFGRFAETDDNAIPFADAFDRMLFVDDANSGRDFGLIPLDSNKRTLLSANRIEAFPETNWSVHQEGKFLRYAVLGLPDEMNVDLPFESDCHIGVPTTFVVTFANDTKVDDETRRKNNQWLVLRLQRQNVFKSIVGMSGGPVLGFRVCENEQLRYWIVGIQSRWLPDDRHILVSPMSTYLAEVRTAIAHRFGRATTS
jgi:hypothetical protein